MVLENVVHRRHQGVAVSVCSLATQQHYDMPSEFNVPLPGIWEHLLRVIMEIQA